MCVTLSFWCEATNNVFKRQTNFPATCPDLATISPCTCSMNKTSKSGLPEVSCINLDDGASTIPLNQVFQNVSEYLDQNGESKEYERLLLVNSKTTALNQSLFHGLKFRFLSVYETNLTTVEATTFEVNFVYKLILFQNLLFINQLICSCQFQFTHLYSNRV